MATPALTIQNNSAPLQREVSRSLSFSTSPNDSFSSRRFSTSIEGTSPNLRRNTTQGTPKHLKPFREEDIKILLLENVNQTGKDILTNQGYQVESLKSSLPEDQLIEKIKYAVEPSLFSLAFWTDLPAGTSMFWGSAQKPNSPPVSSPTQRTSLSWAVSASVQTKST